jgi:hypothetical protein
MANYRASKRSGSVVTKNGRREERGGTKMKKITITKEWLVKKRACSDGMKWFLKEGKSDIYKLIEQLKEVNCGWTGWLITRVLGKIDNVKYAVFAAKQVLEIYEKQYPLDNRPRKAIAAAKAYIDNPTNKNAYAAHTAAYAADDAADADYAVANTAARAARAAAYTAADAAYAAYTAAYTAAYAASLHSSVAAVAAAKKEIQLKIIAYGSRLLRAQEAKK